MTDTSPISGLHAATSDLEPPLAAVDLTALRANAADLVRRARQLASAARSSHMTIGRR